MIHEQVLMTEGFRLEVAFLDRENWTLRLVRDKRILVDYSSAKSREFPSVEKLRYDFEKDVESALRKGR